MLKMNKTENLRFKTLVKIAPKNIEANEQYCTRFALEINNSNKKIPNKITDDK